MLGELFQQLSVSDKEELLFIQLPDTIPGQPKISSPEKPRKEGKTEDKRSSQIKALVSLYCIQCLNNIIYVLYCELLFFLP